MPTLRLESETEGGGKSRPHHTADREADRHEAGP